MTAAGLTPDQALPLFPLHTVLFPQGRLGLQVFEARYLDLISTCLREQRAFGVVCLRQGDEVRSDPGAAGAVQFESVGTLAHIASVDAEQLGLLQVLCKGGSRFRSTGARMQGDGLWLAEGVESLDDDPPCATGPQFADATAALSRIFALMDLKAPGQAPAERRLDDAGWVANRWAELLPAPLAQRQQWLALIDPLARLQEIDASLRRHGVI